MPARALQYAVLGLISSASGGVHGYRLKEQCSALRDDWWALNYGRLYRILDQMERGGELEAFDQIQHGKPNRRVYRITEKGRRSLDDWLLQEPGAGPGPLRDDLVVKLLFLGPGRLDDLRQTIRDQRDTYLRQLARLNRRRRRLRQSGVATPAIDLVVDGAEMRVRADMAWLDHVEREVAGPSREDRHRAHATP